jgi:hypothetical protein
MPIEVYAVIDGQRGRSAHERHGGGAVRPLAVLHKLSQAYADLRQQHMMRDEAPGLMVCPACRAALLNDLDRMFIPIIAEHARGLEGSQVMGFTFSQGTPEQCALGPFVHEAP